ncbi:MAG: hypothetical protein M0R21_01065 [Lentimicrobiaceae bacterium]|jgi:hypothetical protein|nr:hypothetical protein [Lentimicrobiaceae bacterium]
MESAFKFERFKGGTFFHSEVIEINNMFITYQKHGVFLKPCTIAIPLNYITDVELEKNVYRTSIIIKSYSDNKIMARGFSKKQALRIKKLLNN